jgi:hypothetical protein
MEESELKEKQEKALRYSEQPHRFSLVSLKFEMRSNHGVRQVEYSDGRWQCVCEFYLENSTCSHILAVQAILGKSGLNI